jgi:hypothetical protein
VFSIPQLSLLQYEETVYIPLLNFAQHLLQYYWQRKHPPLSSGLLIHNLCNASGLDKLLQKAGRPSVRLPDFQKTNMPLDQLSLHKALIAM